MAKLVVLDHVTPPLVRLVAGLGNVVSAMLLPIFEVVITHGSDGEHKAGSLHPLYAALDVRTKNFPNETEKTAFYVALCVKFPAPRFDVLFEDRGGNNEHIHIEDNAAKPQASDGKRA